MKYEKWREFYSKTVKLGLNKLMETHHGLIHRPSTKPRRVQNKLSKNPRVAWTVGSTGWPC